LGAAFALSACVCSLCGTAANAKVPLVKVPDEARLPFDPPRDKEADEAFAKGIAGWMGDYETATAERKKKLFTKLLLDVPQKDAVIVDIGIGNFPNAKFFLPPDGPTQMDIIGIDPNDAFRKSARLSAGYAGLFTKEKGNTLRIEHAVAEALPFETASVDAVVSTLTLCAVKDQTKAISEIKRVLKPGGKFMFWEHVLSQTDAAFQKKQIEATAQADAMTDLRKADNCHFDRETLKVIQAAGFSKVDGDYFDLDNQGFLKPTIAGIAIA